jgi:hypothetical protein
MLFVAVTVTVKLVVASGVMGDAPVKSGSRRASSMVYVPAELASGPSERVALIVPPFDVTVVDVPPPNH